MNRATKSLRLMGTVIDLSIEDELAEELLAEAAAKLAVYEHRFSANDPASELMAVNQHAGVRPVVVHSELFDLIKIGKAHSLAANSNLNIAIGPLVQTWRIGFKDAKVPTPEEVKERLEKTNPYNIILNEAEQSVYLTETGMAIDLGCLAKGYIADLLAEDFRKRSVQAALINLGGNIMAVGPPAKRNKNYWAVGVQNPSQPRNAYDVLLKVADQSVVTSGIYERQLQTNQANYHHILDPKTGYPCQTDVVSLTIVSDHSVDGEIWTTRLFGKPADFIIQTLDQLPGIDGLVITETGEKIYSKGLLTAIKNYE